VSLGHLIHIVVQHTHRRLQALVKELYIEHFQLRQTYVEWLGVGETGGEGRRGRMMRVRGQ
jgi:hypothetical protein